MANHKSALKAHRRSIKRKEQNKSIKSKTSTYIKKFKSMVSKEVEGSEALVALRKAESEIMKAVSKGVFKLNTGARRVSAITKAYKKVYDKIPEISG